MMNRVDEFLNNLKNYDKEHIPPEVIKALQPYILSPEFVPEKIKIKSEAAAGRYLKQYCLLISNGS